MAVAAEIRVTVDGVSLHCRACLTSVDIDDADWRGRANLWAAAHHAPVVAAVHTNMGTWRNRA